MKKQIAISVLTVLFALLTGLSVGSNNVVSTDQEPNQLLDPTGSFLEIAIPGSNLDFKGMI